MMGFDGLRGAEPQERRPKAARRANTPRLGVTGRPNRDVEMDAGSLISFGSEHFPACRFSRGGPAEPAMGTNQPG